MPKHNGKATRKTTTAAGRSYFKFFMMSVHIQKENESGERFPPATAGIKTETLTKTIYRQVRVLRTAPRCAGIAWHRWRTSLALSLEENIARTFAAHKIFYRIFAQRLLFPEI
ncbi:hypothetical protein [Duganella sp. Leaf126]|uniref:hypothetical protein n=1 Tax=Duganella sp. Leaf126 TaxID=1736266 RepID=UPI00138F3D74|nr:hypothetical protein [Duganella sp. Leaf126]